MGRWSALVMLLALCQAGAPLCHAQATGQAARSPDEAKQNDTKGWPLRVHILAIDDTHRTRRLQPNWASGALPDLSTGEISAPSSQGPLTLGGGDDDFSGAGRADLVTPPDGTVGLDFTYEGCPRVRVPPGFQGLEARWKKAGSKLEVMIPTDAITDGPARMQRCTLKLVTQPFIYLRMPNGAILRVSQEAYNKQPALRVFLSGGSERLQRRTPRPGAATSLPEG
jgi:hypothetical protein